MLLDAPPAAKLARGQVGTVVERLDASTVLVERADDDGVAYAIEPMAAERVLGLRCVPWPA
jgi:hypothetical protein